MNEEGKIMGYDKKTLICIAVLVVVAGVMFYAGAKYEKSKLMKLNLLGDRNSCFDDATGAAVKNARKKNINPVEVLNQAAGTEVVNNSK
jgi:hypothetical protein